MLIERLATKPVTSMPPPELLDWIMHPGSLTEKLKQVADHVSLKILNETWRTPGWWEQNVLKIKQGNIFCREIYISANNNPCWYGRTIIPHHTYHADSKLFSRLQQESLGKIVFNSTSIQRINLAYYGADKNCIEYYWLASEPLPSSGIIWVRFSIFLLNEKYPFYLSEVFLPGIERYLNEIESLS